MAIALLGVQPKHERRIRVKFSSPLAVGAFVPTLYALTDPSATSTAPTVVAAMVVTSNNTEVELALSNDLVRGVIYTLSITAVPAADASTVTDSTTFQLGGKLEKTDVEPYLRDRERIILQSDIIWNGSDYQEAPNGDLQRVEGRANVTKGLWRSIETAGLPWDPSWGVSARDWVDSPSPAGSTLRGSMARQVARDPRVQSVTSTIVQDGNATYINIIPVLISGLTLAPVSSKVDNGST